MLLSFYVSNAKRSNKGAESAPLFASDISFFMYLLLNSPVRYIPENPHTMVAHNRIWVNSLNVCICYIVCINIADKCVRRIICQFHLELIVCFFTYFRVDVYKRQVFILAQSGLLGNREYIKNI